MIDRDQLLKLLKAATPGPWAMARGCRILEPASEEPGEEQQIAATDLIRRESFEQGEEERINNAALIVAAVNALPQLLEEIERYRGALEVIAQYDVGLQALIDDGKDTPEVRSAYFLRQVQRRRDIARSALHPDKGDSR